MRDDKKTRNRPVTKLKDAGCLEVLQETAEVKPGEVEKTREDQLRFLQTLIDTIPSPIFYKNTEGRFLGCNKAFEKRLGLRKEEILGKTSHDVFPKELADKFREMDKESFMSPGEQVYETSLLYADGKIHDVIVYKDTFTDVDGSLTGLVEIAVDITERKKGEKALRKAHEELEMRVRERTSELARANEELHREIAERKRVEEALRESSEKLKLFAYSVAHDLKSPTVGIFGLTKLLCRNYKARLDEKAQKYCEQILKASENVVALVEKINIYAATTEAALVIERVDPKEILRILRDEVSAQLSVRGIHWSEPEAMPEIRADRVSLLRVFRNLVDNALKYGGNRLSRIKVGYREEEKFQVFSVSDNGVGIRRKDAEKIFQLFQRTETSEGIAGTGLGLAIVAEIAEQHGGRIWFEPGIQEGSIFYISIAKDLPLKGV